MKNNNKIYFSLNSKENLRSMKLLHITKLFEPNCFIQRWVPYLQNGAQSISIYIIIDFPSMSILALSKSNKKTKLFKMCYLY